MIVTAPSSIAGRARRCASRRDRSHRDEGPLWHDIERRAVALATARTPCWAPFRGSRRVDTAGAEEVTAMSAYTVGCTSARCRGIHAAALESVSEVYRDGLVPRRYRSRIGQWVALQIELNPGCGRRRVRDRRRWRPVLGGCGINQINPMQRLANLATGSQPPRRGAAWRPRPFGGCGVCVPGDDLIRSRSWSRSAHAKPARGGEVGATREGVLRSRCCCRPARRMLSCTAWETA